jgi:hypothetical protein
MVNMVNLVNVFHPVHITFRNSHFCTGWEGKRSPRSPRSPSQHPKGVFLRKWRKSSTRRRWRLRAAMRYVIRRTVIAVFDVMTFSRRLSRGVNVGHSMTIKNRSINHLQLERHRFANPVTGRSSL